MNTDKKRQDIIRELEIRQALRYRRAQERLLDFIKYILPEYEATWYHEYICKKIDDWLSGVGPPKLIINIPPQHGKSEISSRCLPAFIMGQDPGAKVGILSYSAELANGFNRNVQEYMREPSYQELFPASMLPMQKEMGAKVTQHEFHMPQGGYVKSSSVSGTLTGYTLTHAIVDDCYKDRIEANSPVISEKTWDWFNSVVNSRLHDDGKVLLLFTRWSEDDIAGRLLREYPEQWELIKIPALADAHYLSNVDGNKPEEDPRTEVDEALWPGHHGTKKLQQVREQSPLTFSCLYQQDPTPAEGNIIRKDFFRIMKWGSFQMPPVTWDFFCDTAYTTKTINDPSAIMAAGFDGQYLYIRKMAVVRKELPELVRFIDEFADENGYTSPSRIFVEPKASGLSVIQAMNAETNKNVVQFKFPRVDGTRTSTLDKVMRVFSITAKLEADRVILIDGHWVAAFLAECAAFPNSNRDDQVDNLVMAVLQYFFKKKPQGIKIR